MSTRSGRASHAPKRYRPGQQQQEEPDEDEFADELLSQRRVRPAIRNLPDALAGAAKIQQEALAAILAENKVQTALQKRMLRYLSELNDVLVDIHEALAVATKEVPAQQQVAAPPPQLVAVQLNASKDGAESPATLPLEK